MILKNIFSGIKSICLSIIRFIYNNLINFFVLFLITKTAFFDISVVPSESMTPTLMNGDFVLTYRWPFFKLHPSRFPFIDKFFVDKSFDGSDHNIERGDIVVCLKPLREKLFCKRIIGLPGDTIEFNDYDVKVNGESTMYQEIDGKLVPFEPVKHLRVIHDNGIAEILDVYESRLKFKHSDNNYIKFNTLYRSSNKKERNAQEEYIKIIVPEGSVMLMGDNRKYSGDGTTYFFGFTEITNITARCKFVLFGSSAKFYSNSKILEKYGQNIASHSRRYIISSIEYYIIYGYQLFRRVWKIRFRCEFLNSYYPKGSINDTVNEVEQDKKISIEDFINNEDIEDAIDSNTQNKETNIENEKRDNEILKPKV